MLAKCPVPSLTPLGFSQRKISVVLQIRYSGKSGQQVPIDASPVVVRSYQKPNFYSLSPAKGMIGVPNQKVNLQGEHFPALAEGISIALGPKSDQKHRMPSNTKFLPDDADVAYHRANWQSLTGACEWNSQAFLSCNLPELSDKNGGLYPVYVSFSSAPLFGTSNKKSRGLMFTGLSIAMVPEARPASLFYAGRNYLSVRLRSGEDDMNTNRFFFTPLHGLHCKKGTQRLTTKILLDPPRILCLLPGLPDKQQMSVYKHKKNDALQRLVNEQKHDIRAYDRANQKPFLVQVSLTPGVRSTGFTSLMFYPKGNFSAVTDWEKFTHTFQTWNDELPLLRNVDPTLERVLQADDYSTRGGREGASASGHLYAGIYPISTFHTYTLPYISDLDLPSYLSSDGYIDLPYTRGGRWGGEVERRGGEVGRSGEDGGVGRSEEGGGDEGGRGGGEREDWAKNSSSQNSIPALLRVWKTFAICGPDVCRMHTFAGCTH